MLSEDLPILLKTSRDISWTTSGKGIRFYAPSFIRYENPYFQSSATIFPSISITGNSCSLQCKHCGGRVLSTMIPAPTPTQLIEVCAKLFERNCQGCLISGGCLPDGSIPFRRFLPSIKQIKKKFNFKIIVHTGIVDKVMARDLKAAGVNAALIDIIGSDATIREIYNLDVRVHDYATSLKALHDVGLPFIPHIIVGLHYGKLLGELNALKLISKYFPHALVVIALIPLKGTSLGKCDPPTPEAIARILASAKIIMPRVPVALGCMRPTGRHRRHTDILAVQAGVNAIAFPEEEAIQLAQSLGLNTSFSPFCCSQIYEDLLIPR